MIIVVLVDIKSLGHGRELNRGLQLQKPTTEAKVNSTFE